MNVLLILSFDDESMVRVLCDLKHAVKVLAFYEEFKQEVREE